MISVCPTCEGARQLAAGKYVKIDSRQLDGLDFAPVLYVPSARADSGTEEIPEWVRLEVFIRDGGHCRVPGCSATKHLHFHHLIYRENGGSHDPSNIILLCGGDHRGHHDGRLLIWGTTQDAIDFRHADGTPYGSLPALPART